MRKAGVGDGQNSSSGLLKFYFLVKFHVGLEKFLCQFLVFGSKVGLLAWILLQIVELIVVGSGF